MSALELAPPPLPADEADPSANLGNDDAPVDEERKAMVDAAKATLVSKIQTTIDIRLSQKKELESRWLKDLRQYHGVYEPEKLSSIKAAGGCEEFVNITRSKTNTFIARVEDMLLPTDDKNWGIQPTPVPKLMDAASSKAPLQTAGGQQVVTEEGHPVQVRDMAQGLIDVAKQRADAMEREIDDQLTEAGYNTVQRQVLKDMGIYGTGVLKGPTITNSVKKSWSRVGPDSNNVIQYELTIEQDTQPGVERVSVWNFFPDLTVTSFKQCGDVLERHPSTRKDLTDLAKLPGFDKDALRSLIKAGPQKNTLWFLNELRSIAAQEMAYMQNTLWEVWEYHCMLDRDELEACGLNPPDDELILVSAVIWYCDGEILKAVLNPADNGDWPYSMCYCERDDSSIFGFGYPYLMRNSQNVANGAWRMMIDNAGLSVGPQIIVNRKAITPLDGDYKLKPRKVWEITETGMKVDEAFKAVTIESCQEELYNLFKIACSQADTETNLPLIAQGMDSPDQPDTFGGLSIQHNNATVVLRASVKSYDDDITRTFIPRMYDWNMQNNPKDDIKGDMKTVAKGAGVLLEKERMAQTILQALQVIKGDPEAGFKINKGKVYDQWFKAMRLDDVMNTPEEEQAAREQFQKSQQQQQGGPNNTLQADMLQLRRDLLGFQQQKHNDDMIFKVHELAATLDMDEKDLMAKLAAGRMKMDHESRLFNGEAQLRLKTGAGVGIPA